MPYPPNASVFAYRTGNTRVITGTVTIGGSISNQHMASVGSSTVNSTKFLAKFAFMAGGGSLEFELVRLEPGTSQFTFNVVGTIEAGADPSSVQTQTVSTLVGTSGSTAAASESISATMDVTVHLEEWHDPYATWPDDATRDTDYGLFGTFFNDGDGNPVPIPYPRLEYNPDESMTGPDGLPGMAARKFEVPTLIDVSLSGNGITISTSSTDPFPAGAPVTSDTNGKYNLSPGIHHQSGGGGGYSCSISGGPTSGAGLSWSSTLPNCSLSYSYNPGGTVDAADMTATITGLSVSASWTQTGTAISDVLSVPGPEIKLVTLADVILDIAGRFRRMEQNESAAQTVTYRTESESTTLTSDLMGNFTSSYHGRTTYAQAYFFKPDDPNPSNPTHYGSDYLEQDGTGRYQFQFYKSGTTDRDWRVGVLGSAGKMLSVSWASPNTAWTGSISSSGSGTPSISTSAGVMLEAYRYLRFYVSGPSGQVVNLSANGKSWTFKLDGSGSYDVDTMLPVDPQGFDAQDTRYPTTAASGGVPGTPSLEGSAWGLNRLDSFTLSFPGGTAGGSTLTKVEAFATTKKTNGALTFRTWTPDGSVIAWPVVFSGGPYCLPSGWLDTDGKKLDWWLGQWYDDTVPTFRYPYVSDLKGWLSGVWGLTVTDYTINQFLDAAGSLAFTLPTCCIGGLSGGVFYQGSWIPGYDQTSGDLYGQWVADYYTLYPGAGDISDESGAKTYGSTLLRFYKTRYGEIEGVVGASGSPEVSDTVATSPSVGSGTTNAIGYYLTGSPGASGHATSGADTGLPVSLTLSRPYGHSATGSTTTYPRWRSRGSWILARVFQEVSLGYDVSVALHHLRAGLTTGGNLTLGWSSNAVQDWIDYDTGVPATWARVRFLEYQGALAGVVYGDGSSVYYARETTQTGTLVGITSLGAGAMADFEIASNSTVYIYKTVLAGSNYDVYGRIVDNLGNVVIDWTITNITGIDNPGIAVRSSELLKAFRIGILYSNGGSQFVKYATDGFTFA